MKPKSAKTDKEIDSDKKAAMHEKLLLTKLLSKRRRSWLKRERRQKLNKQHLRNASGFN